MNIFFLDRDPRACARYHCDKHVVRMITEYALILSTVVLHHASDPSKYQTYRGITRNHPLTRWASASLDNYRYLLTLARALCDEYTLRYQKVWKTDSMMREFPDTLDLPHLGLTDPPLLMPDQYKGDDPVAAYRSVYIHEKAYFARWKTQPPPWWPMK